MMINFMFDNREFKAKTYKHAKAIITKYMKMSGKTIYDYFDAKPCYYSSNLQFVKYFVDECGFQITTPFGLACKKTGCKCKELNPVSRDYLRNCLGLSEEAVNLKLKEKGAKSFSTALSNGGSSPVAKAAMGKNPFSYDELISSGMSLSEASEYLKNKGVKSSNTLREKGWYDDVSNNPFSKAFWLKRGLSDAEAQEKVNSRNFWVTGDLPNPGKKEYWESKDDGIELWESKIRRAAHSNTLAGRIGKYGEEEGALRHSEAVANRKFGSSIHSKEATRFFVCLYKALRKRGIQRSSILFSLSSGELKLTDSKKNYFYDFCVGNKIIEYNGRLWHPRRNMMSEHEYESWRNPFYGDSGPRASDIEDKDQKKIYMAEKLGYNVLEIWDFEVKSNKDAILTKCMRFIYEKA